MLGAAGLVYAAGLALVFAVADPDWMARAEVDARVFLAVQSIDDGLLLLVALAFARLEGSGVGTRLGFRRASPRWLAAGVAAGLAAAVLAWGIGAGLAWLGYPVPEHPVETVLAAAEGPKEVALVVLAVTVPVPVAEETFFRGLVYGVLLAPLGPAGAVTLSAVLFAVAHGTDLALSLPVFVIGLVLGLVVHRSGSLWPAVLGHAGVNALALLAG